MNLSAMDVAAVLGRKKLLVRPIQWQRTLGGRDAESMGFDLPLQYADEREAFPESLKLLGRWRPRSGSIPESVQFTVLYRTERIYAVDVQPVIRHKNNVGLGLPWHNKLIYGAHEHVWCKEGYGYAEPLPQFEAPIDVRAVWEYFSHRSSVEGQPFVHPDEGVNFGQVSLL